jgi:hypothetical protein
MSIADPVIQTALAALDPFTHNLHRIIDTRGGFLASDKILHNLRRSLDARRRR